MNFLVTAIIFLYVGFTMLDAVMAGSVAFASTRLTQAMLSTDTTAYVESTSNFPSSMNGTNRGFMVGKEFIGYSSKTSTTFASLQRGKTYGEDDTDADNYSTGAMVMSPESFYLNTLMGFRIIQTEGTWGKLYALGEFALAWAWAIPKFLMWDYTFLEDVAMAKPFLWAISAGFVLVFALYVKKILSPTSS